MWDNRQTWHFAVNDYQGQRRVMHRILLAGSKPVPRPQLSQPLDRVQLGDRVFRPRHQRAPMGDRY